MTSRLFKVALVLGLLSAIGPFAIDMYLPALPSIQLNLNTSVDSAQLSLMAFFVSIAVGQLLYGPAADIFGRKRPIYFGIALFALASAGCALAPDIHTLIAFRFIQGLGACAGMVIPRAIVRDLYTGTEATRLMALLMLVLSVSPILAPLIGSSVIQFWDWRGIFFVITAIALLGLVLAGTTLTETRTRAQRAHSNLRSALAAYGTLIKDPIYVGLVFIGAFASSAFFVYLANSSFVLIDHYGLSPAQYSVAFSVNAVSFIGAAQTAGWFGDRFGLPRVLRVAAVGFAFVMSALLVLTVVGVDSLVLLVAMLFVGYGFMGVMGPVTAVLALDRHGPIAGTASALMGTAQFVTGAVVIAVVSVFLDGTALPMVCGIAGCAVVAMLVTRIVLRRDVVTQPVAEAEPPRPIDMPSEAGIPVEDVRGAA